MKPNHTGEQVGEEPLGIAQERALALHATELLQERERDDLRVREPLEGLVAPEVGVEGSVGVVYEAEEHGYHFFQIAEGGGYAEGGPSLAPCGGESDGPLSTPKPRNRHLGDPDAPALRRPDGTVVARFAPRGLSPEAIERETLEDLLLRTGRQDEARLRSSA